MIPSLMDVDSPQNLYEEELFGADPDKWLLAVSHMKNAAIGNNKQKTTFMNLGVVPRLLQFMIDDATDMSLKRESAILLGSFAKGTEENVANLIDSGCISVLLKDLYHVDVRYEEACLRCLRTIFLSSVAPVDIIYQDGNIVPHLISIMSKSICTQECVTNILANCCTTLEHQTILCSNGAIAALAPLLCSDTYRVQMPALKCFAMMCFQNQQVSLAVATATFNGELIPYLVVKLLARDKPSEMQMLAAKCLTYICRAGSLDPSDQIIVLKALPALVRLCKKDRLWEERVEGAETLAYLTETDLGLQRTASISDHILPTLAEFFKYPGNNGEITQIPTKRDAITVGNELRQAAFRAYASLGANDEDIRKKIIETENLMDYIINGLSDPYTKVQLAAVRCLHSLSRSVQQLRTSFQDHAVWKPLMKILHNAPAEVLTVASSTLCNLLLEFSPSKEPILESGAVELLVGLTRSEDPLLRLNGIWALMNMAFQAEQKIKSQILSCLGPDQLFRLLSDANVDVLMKTLGLLRNLLSNKPPVSFMEAGSASSFLGNIYNGPRHIDQIMNLHGNQIMQAVILILEGDHLEEVKEQALCILANVADGEAAKDFIMSNEDVLKKLMSYMVHTSIKLQIAATFCISNLIYSKDEGALERQAKLRDMGVQNLLQELLRTSDQTLYDKVKTALQQF